jgi:2-octaprenyl-6-methoxyphenol hydroxylase
MNQQEHAMKTFDIAIVGGGLTGSIAAIAFARRGFTVALVAPDDGRSDGRTTALMDNSIRFVDELGLWNQVEPHAAALKTMQIIDATERLIRAPAVAFRAAEIGLDAFGYNIPNAAFLAVLAAAIDAEAAITTIGAVVERIAPVEGAATVLSLSDGAEIAADLVVGADGRQSRVRQAAGIDARTVTYPQTALVLNLAHDRPHGNTSTEFHTETGPFTVVPLSGLRSSLVWVVRPEQAGDLIDMTDDALNRRIETRMGSMLGKVRIEGRPQAWPLSAITARAFGKDAMVLVGEAAHVFPPIGAQGLNLSLRDIQSAVELAGKARDAGQPLAIGAAYDRARRADVLSRTAGIDLLNRSLLSGFLPVQMLRAGGLQLLSSVPPLRHLMMQEGVAPGRAFRGFPDFLRKKIERQRA